MTERQRLSIKYIESSACDWPMMVKRLAVDIIRLRADLASSNSKMVDTDMMTPEKILLLNQVSDLHRKLGNAYKNLANELVVNLATVHGRDGEGN
jgi:hypothetical protein